MQLLFTRHPYVRCGRLGWSSPTNFLGRRQCMARYISATANLSASGGCSVTPEAHRIRVPASIISGVNGDSSGHLGFVGDSFEIDGMRRAVAGRSSLSGTVRQIDNCPSFEQHPSAGPLCGRRDAVRLRHGDWRAICRIDRAEDTVVLETVAHRREAYR